MSEVELPTLDEDELIAALAGDYTFPVDIEQDCKSCLVKNVCLRYKENAHCNPYSSKKFNFQKADVL